MSASATSELVFKPTEVEDKNDVYLGNLLRQCEEKKAVFNKGIVGWLQELRQQAAYEVVKGNLPTKNDEEWRFTDISGLLEHHFQVAQTVEINQNILAAFKIPEANQSRLTFVNGVYAPKLSSIAGLPEGLYVGNLADLPESQSEKLVKYLGQQEGKEEVFTALNTSGLSDIAIVWAQANVVVETPIHLLFLSAPGNTPIFIQPRVLVVAEKGANLEIIEYYGAITTHCSDFVTNHPYFTNAVTEIWLEENAQVKHNRIQRDSGDAFHIGKTAIAQARDSRYTCIEVNLGAKLSRHNLEILQTGEQTETYLNGLTIIGLKQTADTHSIVKLSKPYGTTNQLHKCIVDDGAHSIFSGKIFVPKAAQLTNASQLNHNLVLSSKARIDTKPELQITADNVKCSHGATVSQLEADEIFYLRSRGLNEYDARHLLIDAFAAEILDKITIKSLQHRLMQCATCRTIE